MLRVLSVARLASRAPAGFARRRCVEYSFRVYPRRKARKRSALAISALAVALAGCGGGKSTATTSGAQKAAGPGFSFGVPSGWQVTQTARSATVKPGSGPALASATVLPLLKRYRPALFPKAAVELDRVTATLAQRLNAKVIAKRTIVVAGEQARQYDLAYSRGGAGLVDRITYLLRGKSEYYLLCRWPADQGVPSACALLTSSFRLG
jgi:hypothetical protein